MYAVVDDGRMLRCTKTKSESSISNCKKERQTTPSRNDSKQAILRVGKMGIGQMRYKKWSEKWASKREAKHGKMIQYCTALNNTQPSLRDLTK